MNVFRERELLEKQENDFEINSKYAFLPIPKRSFIEKIQTFQVGEVVWYKGHGPRIITSVRLQDEETRTSFVTLAEEYGRININNIFKYKVIDHLDWLESLKSKQWDFVYKYGLSLCLIPLELTCSIFCILLNIDIYAFKDFSPKFLLLSIISLCLMVYMEYLVYKQISNFIKKVRNLFWKNKKHEELNPIRIMQGFPPPDRIRVVNAEGNANLIWNNDEEGFVVRVRE